MLLVRHVISLALALGAGTQHSRAFVVAPHRLVLSPRVRSCSSVPGRQALPLSDRDGSSSAWESHGRGRRGRGSNTNVNGDGDGGLWMRAGRPGRERGVVIEGAGGETRRVDRRSRKPDLKKSMRKIGLQAAAAVVVQQEQGVDVQTETEDQEALDAKEAEAQSLAERYEAAQGLKERQMMEEEQAGTVLDKYTQIYIPMDGVVIKKTYGFWTWQVFGLIFIQHFVRNIIRKGGSLKKTSMSELNWDHIVTEPEHLLELKAYCCEECGYTLFPARGRHEVFFDEVEDFQCPECGAPRSAFYDANDKDDPHNIKRNEEAEAKAKAGADENGGGADEGNVGGVVASATAGSPSSVADAKSPSATTTTAPASASPAAPASSTPVSKAAPPQGNAGETSIGAPPDKTRADGDDDGDDLLDF